MTLDPQTTQHLKRDPNGLVAAAIQQCDTRGVLMLGWMDEEALDRTLNSGRVTSWPRSRRKYWHRGDTSGHVQYVKSVSLNYGGDTLPIEADQVGAVCHTGKRMYLLEGGDLGIVASSAKNS